MNHSSPIRHSLAYFSRLCILIGGSLFALTFVGTVSAQPVYSPPFGGGPYECIAWQGIEIPEGIMQGCPTGGGTGTTYHPEEEENGPSSGSGANSSCGSPGTGGGIHHSIYPFLGLPGGMNYGSMGLPSSHSRYPTSISRGAKREDVTDLVVDVPGKPFVLQRTNFSETDWRHAGFLGYRWGIRGLDYIVASEDHDSLKHDWRAFYYVNNSGYRMRFEVDEPGASYTTFNDDLTSDVDFRCTSSSGYYATFNNATETMTVTKKGEWKAEFPAPRGETASRGRKRIEFRDDPYGQRVRYHWDIGSVSVGTSTYNLQTLRAITIGTPADPALGVNGTFWGPTVPSGTVAHDPYMADVHVVINFVYKQLLGSGYKIKSAQVYRRADNGANVEFVWSQEVRYSYLQEWVDFGGNGIEATAGSGITEPTTTAGLSHLGRAYDLVQVEQFTPVESTTVIALSKSDVLDDLFDASIYQVGTVNYYGGLGTEDVVGDHWDDSNLDKDEKELRRQVTQYRYYDYSEDFRPIKMVLLPAQIEYYEQSPTNARAEDLPFYEDDEQPYQATFNTVQEYAAKHIEYLVGIVDGINYTSTHDDYGKVKAEEILTDCGCGGVGQGLRIEYQYLNDDNDLLSAYQDTGEDPEERTGVAYNENFDGTTESGIAAATVVTELIQGVVNAHDPEDPNDDEYDWVPYRETWYDMIELVDQSVSTSTAADDRTELVVKYKAVLSNPINPGAGTIWVWRYDYYGESTGDPAYKPWTGSTDPNTAATSVAGGYHGQLKRTLTPSAIGTYWRTSAVDPMDDGDMDVDELLTNAEDVGLVIHRAYYTGKTQYGVNPTYKNGQLRAVAISDAEYMKDLISATTPDSLAITDYYQYTEAADQAVVLSAHFRWRDEDAADISDVNTDTIDSKFQEITDLDTGAGSSGDYVEVGRAVYVYDNGFDASLYGSQRTGFYALIERESDEHLSDSHYDYEDIFDPPSSSLDYSKYYLTYTEYDSVGRVKYVVDPTGAATVYDYGDALHSSPESVTRTNWGEINALNFGILGGSYDVTTSYEHDALGRVTASIAPSGARTEIRRMMLGDGHRHPDDLQDSANTQQSRYAEVVLPPQISSSNTAPVTVSYFDADDNYLGMLEFDDWDPDTETAFPSGGGSWLGRTFTNRDLARNATSELRYPTASSGATSNDAYTTSYSYDTLGRVTSVTNAAGTIWQYEYDVLDRVIEELVGVSEPTMETVAEYGYDLSGNLTSVIESDGSGTRTTGYTYDFRDRLTTITPADPTTAPTVEYSYDHVGRIAQRELQDSADNVGMLAQYEHSQRGTLARRTIEASLDDANDNLLEWLYAYDAAARPIAVYAPNSPAIKTVYDEIGRSKTVYVTDGATAISSVFDPASVENDIVLEEAEYAFGQQGTSPDGDAGKLYLVTTRTRALETSDSGTSVDGPLSSLASTDHIDSYYGIEYDDIGRVVKHIEFGTNHSANEYRYDGTAPTAPFTLSDDERVLTTAYGERGLISRTSIKRSASDTMTTGYRYDDLARHVAMIENMKNDDAVEAGTTHPWGWQMAGTASTAPDEDRVTFFGYDEVDNLIYRAAVYRAASTWEHQVTHYEYGVSSASGSDLSANDLLAYVTYPDEYSETNPKKVKYEYNRLGEIIGIMDQNGTEHDYTRDDLGRVIKDEADVISDAVYGRGGVGTEGDAPKIIEYFYDEYGRPEHTLTTTKGGIWRNHVAFSYTDLWQIDAMYYNPTGAIGSDLHALPSLMGQPSDADDDASIEYTYDEQTQVAVPTSSSRTYSRLDMIRYPSTPVTASNRTVLKHAYGAGHGASTLDDSISRMTQLAWGREGSISSSDSTFTADYLGLAVPVVSSLNEPEISLDRRYSLNNALQDGIYPGYDRFGRVQRQLWTPVDYDTAAEWAPPGTPGGAHSYIDVSYTYDLASNILGREDNTHSVQGFKDRDDRYEHDGLHRLKAAYRGAWDPDIFDSQAELVEKGIGETWVLDELSNWKGFTRESYSEDGQGDPQAVSPPWSASDSVEVYDVRDEDRASNDVNEITELDDNAANGGGGVPTMSPDYDDNGNLYLQPKALVNSSDVSNTYYLYDAWNRLVRVEKIPEGTTPAIDGDGRVTNGQFRARYEYNALHQRTVREADEDLSKGSNFDPTRQELFYYDASWRLLERRLYEDTDATEGQETWGLEKVIQHFWGPDYIDQSLAYAVDEDGTVDGDLVDAEMLYTLTDRKYDVLGVIDESGARIERVRYTSYGESITRDWILADLDGDGVVGSGDMSVLLAEWGNSDSPGDLDADGTVGASDMAELTAAWDQSGEPHDGGRFSEHENVVGYSGYLYDQSIEMYMVRNRWYSPVSGSWLTRDPLNYIDGSNMYQYAASSPHVYTDWLGLTACPDPIVGTGVSMRTCRTIERNMRRKLDIIESLFDSITLRTGQLFGVKKMAGGSSQFSMSRGKAATDAAVGMQAKTVKAIGDLTGSVDLQQIGKHGPAAVSLGITAWEIGPAIVDGDGAALTEHVGELALDVAIGAAAAQVGVVAAESIVVGATGGGAGAASSAVAVTVVGGTVAVAVGVAGGVTVAVAIHYGNRAMKNWQDGNFKRKQDDLLRDHIQDLAKKLSKHAGHYRGWKDAYDRFNCAEMLGVQE